jgi:hypothetical protein
MGFFDVLALLIVFGAIRWCLRSANPRQEYWPQAPQVMQTQRTYCSPTIREAEDGKQKSKAIGYMVWLRQGCPQPQTYNYSTVREALETCGPGDDIWAATEGNQARALNDEKLKELAEAGGLK